MKELLKNVLDKKLWIFLKIFTRISRVNGRNEKGVKGMPPLGCLPLWGSEGITFLVSGKNIR
jgi:hypothetical protein